MRLFALERFVGSSLPRVGASGFGSQRTPGALLGPRIWWGHPWACSPSPSMGIRKAEPGCCLFPHPVLFSGGYF